MKVIKLAHDNQRLRQDKDMLLNLLEEDNRLRQQASGEDPTPYTPATDPSQPGPLLMNDPTTQWSGMAVGFVFPRTVLPKHSCVEPYPA
jgi:hypothetical protein